MITDYARLVIEADSRSVKSATADLDNFSGSAGKTTTSVASLVKNLAGLAAAYGVVGAATAAIRTTANFQQAIADLSAITGATGRDLEYYSEQAALIGRTTSLSASEAATAFKLIASAKPDLLSSAASLTAVTKEAVALAEATGESLPAAASALGAALNQFQLPASDASRVINVLAASSQLGTAEVGAVTEAMRNAGSAANSLGLDFEETVAGIQALAASGRQGADAGTALRQVLLRLESTADQTLQPSIVGLDNALQELATRNLDNTQLMDLFGQEAFTAATSLLAQKDVVTDLNVSLRGTSTAYEQAATRMDTFSGDVLGLKSAMEGLQISAMTTAVDGLGRSLVQTATGGLNMLTENMDALKTVAEVMTVVVGTRLVAAFVASAAAKASAAASAVPYQLALARMAGLSTTAAAAQTALGVATTAANRALTLIGGPMGALLLTGAAMYAMWNRNKEAVEFFTSSIGVAKMELAALGRASGDLTPQIDVVTAAIKETTMQLDNTSVMFGENSRDSRALKEELRNLENQLFDLNRRQDAYNIQVAKGTEGTSQFVGPIRQVTAAMDDMSTATSDASSEMDEMSQAAQGVISKLQAEIVALGMTDRQLFIHNQTVVNGIELSEEHKTAIEEVAGSLYDQRQSIEAAKKQQELSNAQTQRSRELLYEQNTALGTARSALNNHAIAAQLSARDQHIFNVELDALAKGYAPDAAAQLGVLAGQMYDQKKAIDFWTAATQEGASKRAKAEEESARRQQEAYTRTHEYLTTSFIDIFNNGKNAFDNIAKAFSSMIQRMLAEWAASKLMDFIGMGSGTPTANPFSQLASSTLGTAVQSALGIGGGTTAAGTAGGAGTAGAIGSAVTAASQFIGGASGTAIGAGSALAGPPTAAAAAGSGIAAGIGGAVKAVGSAISGGASAATAFVMANPLLAAAALAAAAAAALAKKPTYSSNAGLLIHDAPGASADRKFAVDPFESGFAPIGFARREDQSAANQVIDVFRKYDASLTEIAKAAGLNVNFSNNPFGGFDEKGQGNGLFLGTAAEEKKGVTSAPIDQQLTQFTKQWVEALGGQVSPADREFLLSSASADQLLERAATLGQPEMGRIDGSHYNGLDRVPFNGYMAQLHRGERVLTASEADAMDSLGMGDLMSVFKAIASHTAKTARQLERWDFNGLPEERTFA
jgi:TP901 family phage tail tape measure protein